MSRCLLRYACIVSMLCINRLCLCSTVHVFVLLRTGRLNAKVDKVGDRVETRRPDKKNAQYQEVVKRGDLLLNQVQRLVRVIDV